MDHGESNGSRMLFRRVHMRIPAAPGFKSVFDSSIKVCYNPRLQTAAAASGRQHMQGRVDQIKP